MRLFDYYEIDSPLHRLNPTIKSAAIGIALLAVVLALDPYTPSLFLLTCMATLRWLGRIPLRSIGRGLAPFWIFALGLLVANALFFNVSAIRDPTILARIGPLIITAEGLSAGLSMGIRAVAIVSFSMLFLLTTDPTDFALSLIQQARLNYRFGYGVMISYRFLPLLSAEFEIIRAAHRVRGFGERHGWRGWLQRFQRYSMPLLASAIRRSERVAIAMESKAFGSSPQRTYYRRLRVNRKDWLFLMGAVAGSVGIYWLVSQLSLLRFGLVPT